MGKFRQVSQLSSNDRSTLVQAVRDRAVLLLEIHDFVLLHHLKLTKQVVEVVHDLQALIADKCPEEAVSNQRFA